MIWKRSRQESNCMSWRQLWKCIVPTLKQTTVKDKTFSLPHQALQSQQVRSDTQTYAPGRWCQVEQTVWKHRWINVYTNLSERDGNYPRGPALHTWPPEGLCARCGSAVCRAALQWCWAAETNILPAPELALFLLPLCLLAWLRKGKENTPSVAQHRLVEKFN